MELLLSLMTKQEFNEGWKSAHLMLCLSTVTVMSLNWLLCKLLMQHRYQASLYHPDDVMEVLSLLSKHAESLKEIQKVLNLPEFKIVKPSGTRWLAHEHCVKAVKASYSSIVLVLENIYETSHEPEAHGLRKALSSHSTQQQQCTYLTIFFLKWQSLAMPFRPSTWTSPLLRVQWILLLIHLMMLYCLQQIGFYSYKMQKKN